MSETYGRDLDLNLLRVFVVVAESKSVTLAASRLYLTQPAISAALKRLSVAVGASLFARQGRGLVLTARGEQLLARGKVHLEALLDAALEPGAFDPLTSDRTIHIGLSDSAESWLLPELVRLLTKEAPRMRLAIIPVHFRTVGALLASGSIDFALTVADDLPAGTRRKQLFSGGFSCLYDPRHAKIGKKLTRVGYLAHHHVVVSYNGDFRGVIEDSFGVTRTVRVSIPSFRGIGSLIEGSAMLATIPTMIAKQIVAHRPKLRLAEPPFQLRGTGMELIWRSVLDDDPATQFVMGHAARIAREVMSKR